MTEGKGIIADISDNVCTVVTEVKRDSIIICKYSKHSNKDNKEIRINAKNDIPIYHKIAIMDIHEGSDIIKYGEIIGKAKKPIDQGEHVHIHNVNSNRVQGDLDK